MHLSAQSLHFAYAGGKTLLDDVSVLLADGERVALVGENGAGKSSLLSVLTGRRAPDGGKVVTPKGVRVGVLLQTPELDPEATVRETARSGLDRLIGNIAKHEALCQQLDEGAEDYSELEALTEAIERDGGFSIEHRVDHVLANLGLVHLDQQIKDLSGGERRRADLARILLFNPEVLLLDEPTNHLDRQAVHFLGDFLKKRQGSTLFISHDRDFLDAVATRIIELDGGKCYDHQPPYSVFVENRFRRIELEKRTHARKKRILAREVAWLRAGVKARTTKQNARIERAHTLIDEVASEVERAQEKTIQVRKAKEGRLAKTIVEFKDVSIGRGDRLFFEGLKLALVKGERWGIIGRNGAGKSTLLGALLGTVEPRKGSIAVGKHTKVGVLDQHRTALTENLTVQERLCPDGGDTVYIGDTTTHVASYLERFLFDPSDRHRQVQTLSGGEQNRLQLAKLFAEGNNCLLLDEPTNDLDVTTLGVLEQALGEHDGVALIVSHDRTFLDRVCTGILAFEPTTDGAAAEHDVIPVQGDYTHYLRTRGEKLKSPEDVAAAKAKVQRAAIVTAPKADSAPKKAKSKTKRSYKEEQEFLSIENVIAENEDRRKEIEAKLADGSIFSSEPETANKLSQELADIGPAIEKLYDRWQVLDDIGGG